LTDDRSRSPIEDSRPPLTRARLLSAFAGHYLSWLVGRRRSSATARVKTGPEHRADVARLQERLVGLRGPVRLLKRGGGHEARARETLPGAVLDLRHLDAVVSLDAAARTVLVEPQVTMRQLLNHTASVGLAPAVIPEFPEITVGGAVQGLAAESSSHRFGLFHESLEWMDVVLGNGTLLRVSPTENEDLWHGLPGSYGSLAIIVLACLGLRRRRQHVRVMHRRVDLAELVEADYSSQHDFVDAVCDRGDEVVVTIADLRDDDEPGSGGYRTRWFDEYYCDHVMGTSTARGPEMMTFEDYVFRYDRGAFWIAPTKLGRSLLSRLVFGGFATAANLYRLRRTKQAISSAPSSRLVQDCIVPLAQAPALVEHFRDATDGPLWLLPMTSRTDDLFGLEPGTWMNVGAYVRLDLPSREVDTFNRRTEEMVAQLGGFKTLHAQLFYDQDRFASIYDMKAYEGLRSTYRADGTLAHIHDKLGIAGSDGR